MDIGIILVLSIFSFPEIVHRYSLLIKIPECWYFQGFIYFPVCYFCSYIYIVNFKGFRREVNHCVFDSPCFCLTIKTYHALSSDSQTTAYIRIACVSDFIGMRYESAFITISQVIPVLPPRDSHFEHHP